jgi:hypothetical protein
MRAALQEFQAQQQQQHGPVAMIASSSTSNSGRSGRLAPRQIAFYAALHAVLEQVLAETTPDTRHARLLAAHAWFVRHKPRPCASVSAHPDLTAALAASLSIRSPAGAAAAAGMGAAGDTQQQQPCADACGGNSLLPQRPPFRLLGTAPGPPAAAIHETHDDSSSSSDDQDEWSAAAAAAAAAACRQQQHAHTSGDGRANAAADAPGLISIGCLPSGRFAAAAAAGCLQGSEGLLTGNSSEAWAGLARKQAAVEGQVATSLRQFARQQARLEEGISVRQELASAAAVAAAAAAAAPAAPRRRQLLHVDSQHQPSAVSAMLGRAASTASGHQLVVPDRVKAARQQHLSDAVQECAQLQQALGLPSDRLARALLPMPEVAYISAMAALPAGFAGSAHMVRKKRRSKSKTKKAGGAKKKASATRAV